MKNTSGGNLPRRSGFRGENSFGSVCALAGSNPTLSASSVRGKQGYLTPPSCQNSWHELTLVAATWGQTKRRIPCAPVYGKGTRLDNARLPAKRNLPRLLHSRDIEDENVTVAF